MKRALALVLLAVAAAAACDKPAPAPAVTVATTGNVVELTVTKKGFEPTPVTVKAGEPVTLKVTRKTDETCATELVMKEFGIHAALPKDKEVLIRFTPKTAGELKYGCAMDMMVSGVLVVE